jgi:hypothetical protein
MTEEIEIDWPTASIANLGNLVFDLFRRKHAARQRSERSALDCGDAKIDSARTRHRRLNDRVFGSDQIGKSAVGPAHHSP